MSSDVNWQTSSLIKLKSLKDSEQPGEGNAEKLVSTRSNQGQYFMWNVTFLVRRYKLPLSPDQSNRTKPLNNSIDWPTERSRLSPPYTTAGKGKWKKWAQCGNIVSEELREIPCSPCFPLLLTNIMKFKSNNNDKYRPILNVQPPYLIQWGMGGQGSRGVKGRKKKGKREEELRMKGRASEGVRRRKGEGTGVEQGQERLSEGMIQCGVCERH